jgi:hypothetical protein
MTQKMVAITTKKRQSKRQRAHWIDDQFVCDCASREFTIFREEVARKVRKRNSHRRRKVAICENGHKTRIGFPSSLKH